MKKILIIFLFFMIGINVKAATGDTMVIKNYMSKVYYSYEDSGVIHWAQMSKVFANGNLVYCLDIKELIKTTTYSSTGDISLNENILLIGYFGYGYKDHITIEYYLASQQLIWEELGVNVRYTDASEGTGNNISVETFKEDIINHISNYKGNLELENNFNYIINSTNNIMVKSGDIKEYSIVNESDNNININNDEIIIEAKDVGEYSFSLIKKYDSRGYTRLYEANNSQPLLYVGRIANKEYTYSYNISAGSISVDIVGDSYAKNNNLNVLGNIFALYDSKNNLINEFEIDETKKIYIDKLGLGSYYIKHIKATGGYQLDPNKHEIEINSNTLNKNITINLMPKRINFNIQKLHGNPILGTIFKDYNVEFKIINSNDIVEHILYTDENGRASIPLYYDEYRIVQDNGDEYVVRLGDFNGDNYYNVYTPIYDSKLKIYVYDDNNNLINDGRLLIDDKYYNISNGLVVTEYLKTGTHNIIFNENNLYESFYDTYILDENSKFYMENGDVLIDYKVNMKVKVVPEVIVDKGDIIDNPIIKDESKPTVTEVQEPILINVEKLPNLYNMFCLRYR